MQLFPLRLTYVKEMNMEKHVDFLDIPLIWVRIQSRSAYKHNNNGDCCGVRSELEGGEKERRVGEDVEKERQRGREGRKQ